jgi:hypothetical protein
MTILTKPKCSKPREFPRVMKGNQIPRVCRNLSYWSDRYCTPVSLVGPVPDQVRFAALVCSSHQVLETFSGLSDLGLDMSIEPF